MTTLRIAMIGSRGVPATFGGVERHVEELGKRLSAAGHEVVVYCRSSYQEEQPESYEGMTLRYTPTVDARGLESFVHSGVSAADSIRGGFDVVHFHALGPGLFTPIPRYLSRSAVVQTIHGLDDQRDKWGGAATQLLRAGGWMSARVPDVTITVSQALRSHYNEVHGRPAIYVPNGVPVVTAEAPGSGLAGLGLTPGGYVLWVGRIVPEKAPDQLVRAFRDVPGDVRLVLAGGSSHTDAYAAEVRALAAQDSRVIMPGYVYGSDLAELYSHAAAFVQPSLLEGLPITLLEAAAYGRPLVVSDIPPHTEVVSEPGPGREVARTGDIRGLTDAIIRTLESPVAAAAGAAELSAQVVQHYDWDRAAAMTLRSYEIAMAVNGRPVRRPVTTRTRGAAPAVPPQSRPARQPINR